MTYLQLINKILIKLRLDEVTSVTQDAYTKLIGQLVNEAKIEVEDSWTWNPLRTSILIETEADTFAYALTGAGDRGQLLYDRYGRGLVWDITDQSRMLGPMPTALMTEYLSFQTSTGQPLYYDMNGIDDNNDPIINVWPVPGGEYDLQVDMYIPQADLASANTDITVPWYPVYLGAYAKAIAERGEDGSISYSKADQAYREALAVAVINDSGRHPDELTIELI